MKLIFVTSLFLAMATAFPGEAEMTVNKQSANCEEDCVDRYCMGLGNMDYVACMLACETMC